VLAIELELPNESCSFGGGNKYLLRTQNYGDSFDPEDAADGANLGPNSSRCATIKIFAATMMRSAIFLLSLMVATAVFGGNAQAVH
jgi:hypothetical protein